MKTSHRAKIARHILQALDQLKSNDEVDLIFQVFGLAVPSRETYGPREEPSILATASDQVLLGLAEHLEIEVPEQMGVAPPSCWNNTGLRVFISHVSAKKAVARSVADQLSPFGLDCFVAHDDIEPTADWAKEIQAALRTCDVMIALMSEGFRESAWCDQEVGAAVGRMIPIISLHYDHPPHGFAGLIQGIPVKGKDQKQVLPQVLVQIIKNPSTAGAASLALARALRHSTNWSMSNSIAGLFQHVIRLDSEAVRLIQEAVADNGEVSGSNAATTDIPALMDRFGHQLKPPVSAEPAVDSDEVPF